MLIIYGAHPYMYFYTILIILTQTQITLIIHSQSGNINRDILIFEMHKVIFLILLEILELCLIHLFP